MPPAEAPSAEAGAAGLAAAPIDLAWSGAGLGAVGVALVDVVSAQLAAAPFPVASRIGHLAWDLGLTVALGLGLDAAIWLLRRLARRSRLLFGGLLWAGGSLFAYLLLDRLFARQADSWLDGRVAPLIHGGLVLAAGAGLALAQLLGTWLATASRAWLRLAAPLVALVAAIASVSVYRDDYHEGHTAIAVGAMLLSGPALAARLKAWSVGRGAPERTRRAVVACALSALAVALVPPPNAVRLALFRSPGAAGAWLAALHVWQLPELGGEAPPELDRAWLERDGEAPPRAPSRDRLGGAAPVVVLLTIDALRADVVADASAREMPTFARLHREGVYFERARSPGSQTAVSLTTLFSGKYFSELRWAKYGHGKTRFEYAAEDPSPRVPALLTERGVATTKVVSLSFLHGEFGVAPGFAEEIVVTEGRRHARASEVIPPLLDRLRHPAPGQPMFLFAHLTEPHSPYDRGKLKTGPPLARYRSEVAEADRWVGRVLSELSKPGLAGRSLLIVSSDHGEAFGEHGTTEHTKTLYEELLRVPLFAWGAGVVPRRLDVPVSLVDLAPTLLDVFGAPTPADFKGESLVPLLAGRDVGLTRPLLAEGRLRRALIVGDRKVIVDHRRKTIELYDLRADPLELSNLAPAEGTAPLVAALDAFFSAHGYSEGGYTPPYKP